MSPRDGGHNDWCGSRCSIPAGQRLDGRLSLAGDATMTWSVQVETGDNPVWLVGITDEMIAAARGNIERDMVNDVSREVSEQERDSLKGNIGELVVQELLITGDDATRWEYVNESETDLLRDGSLKLDVKTRDVEQSFGQLLCRRRYVHLNCGGALDMDDDRRCARCGETEVEYYYREALKSDMYMLVLLPFSSGTTIEADDGPVFARKMGLMSDDEFKKHEDVKEVSVGGAFPLDFAVVIGMASRHKVEAGEWLENERMPDPAHEVRQDDLDDASRLLGWA